MVIIFLVIAFLSASPTLGAVSCFVPAKTPTIHVNIAPLSMGSSGDGQQSDGKLSRNFITRTRTRIPRHQEEAVGITGGLGLWGEIRQRSRKQRRKILKEKLTSIRLRRSGRRRRILASRFKKYLLRDKASSSLGSDEPMLDEDVFDSSMDAEQGEDDNMQTSLDAMRARAGVLRTRIRLREESLSALEKIMTDTRLEVKRMEWKNVFDANGGYTNRQSFMYGQTNGEEVSGEADTDDVMNEYQLASINKKWKDQQIINGNGGEQSKKEQEPEVEDAQPSDLMDIQLDRMETRSLKLQNSILLDRIRLQRLDRRILCFESDELGILEKAVGNTLDSLNEFDFLENNPFTVVQRQARKFANTFGESSSVLVRKLDRVSSQSGPNNRDYASVTDFVVQETAAGVRIVGSLLSNPSQLSQLIDPETPTLAPHLPAILARLDRLESHVAPILSLVLNNKKHLRSIEPYLDEVLERFDDIEPHLPWILDHVDTLAPYTGLLLKHIDELLLYAEVDEYEACGTKKDNYAFAEQLLPYLEVYVSQLDLVGPHLPLLRPHLPLLLKHNRIKILSPHVGVLFAKGYKDLSASANMDILLYYFGWALRIPFVPRLFFSFPGSPGMVGFLANRLPKRLVRGKCCDVSCYVDGDYGGGWNELKK